MKTNKLIILIALCTGCFSCEDWTNTAPDGQTKTTEQKEAASKANPEAAQGDVNAMYGQMIDSYSNMALFNQRRDNDFGYPAICLFTEEQGMDCFGPNIGYNWFGYALYPNNRDNSLQTADGMMAHLVWNDYYKMILAANTIIGSIDEDNPRDKKNNLGQALAFRAFVYFQLAQIYQFPYQDVNGQNKPCVPLVVPNMPEEKQCNNPRATVEEVYALIMHDLNLACDILSDYKRTSNGFIDQAVAYGIRARVNLVMGNNAQAATDAKRCLELSQATPLTMNEAHTPGFADANAHNVIWSNIITGNNDCVQTDICNWPSFYSTFYLSGYAGLAGVLLQISKELYDLIPSTDVRKDWWLDENLKTKMELSDNYKAALDFLTDKLIPYTNVKFGTADGTTTNRSAAASDWIIMRAEEMHLIIAEANKDGAYLEHFVQEYRDPSYKFNGDVVEAVWNQRRIELWGEGFAFTDLLRLHKPIIRNYAGTNWPAAWVQNIPANHPILLWQIPQAEIQANAGISEADNNPIVSL